MDSLAAELLNELVLLSLLSLPLLPTRSPCARRGNTVRVVHEVIVKRGRQVW